MPFSRGLARPGETAVTGGPIRARAGDKRTLAYAAFAPGGQELGYYELDAELKLRRVDDAAVHAHTKEKTAIPRGVLTTDEASVLYVDGTQRWRLPRGDAALDAPGPLGEHRVCREVATERDLFNAHGTFYELPANNAGGFAKARAVATHNRRIHDYCSYRGLLVISGLGALPTTDNPHVRVSDDGKTALWLGAVDDVWRLGKPRGFGGPWKNTAVQAGQPSDPYLFNGYDQRTLTLSHDAARPVTFTVSLDLTGAGDWQDYQTFTAPPGGTLKHTFPEACQAYWVRVQADLACRATARLVYD